MEYIYSDIDSVDLRLLNNIVFYCMAFPECLVDGEPEEIKPFNKFYKAKNRIKINEELFYFY